MNEEVSERLIRLYTDKVTPGICTSPRCGAMIDYYETCPKHKQMPMNKQALPRHVDVDPETQRPIGFFPSAESHFATCKDADIFRATRKRTPATS